jgi:type III restriction enzyme
MSLQYKIADQVLKVTDESERTQSIIAKYDAFLNLFCSGKYAFQREAIRTPLAFLISEKYPNTEALAVENFNGREVIQKRYESKAEFLDRMPLRDHKAVSVDLATGAGKSYVIYGLAAIALAEGLVDKVLVLCPSLTIEDGLREKFGSFIGNSEFTVILKEIGAVVATPGLKTGNESIDKGDICVENIHAVYERTGTSIYDSFKNQGTRVLVLNDEAHHIFSKADAATKKWMEFLKNPDYNFQYIVNFTGTPYIGNEYFPDVVCRYGLKQAIEDKVVKKPNYKEEQTYKGHSWDVTYEIHEKNRVDFGDQRKSITIVVTESIAKCVEVWGELVKYLMKKEKLGREDAEKRCIWVTSGIPSGKTDKERIEAVVEKPEKKRSENLALLKKVDDADNPVEWIVSVSMLTEGWDVKNVFQIVPHESRAFNSKLLIAQVLGRGLRVPPGMEQPLVTINNHEKWEEEIHNLLKEILEIENQLGWGYLPDKREYLFPLYNLEYDPVQTTVETKTQRAKAPEVSFKDQRLKTEELSVFSETGTLKTEIENPDWVTIPYAAKLLKMFMKEKDSTLAKEWTLKRIEEFIKTGLSKAGQDISFLSKKNLLSLQQAFGPMFRDLNQQNPRISQRAKNLKEIDLADPKQMPRQVFSESALKQHGTVYYAPGSEKGFTHEEANLWVDYLKKKKVAQEVGEADLSEDARQIAKALEPVDAAKLKTPWNIHYASYEPERVFSRWLIEHADLFDSFVKMPDRGVYSFPYSYKPANAARTHLNNENFNPDFFIRLRDSYNVLVVEIKGEEDRDKNRSAAKFRDGKRHFETLNEKLSAAGKQWKYYFFFLSPEDFTKFFEAVKEGSDRLKNWTSSLMQELKASDPG